MNKFLGVVVLLSLTACASSPRRPSSTIFTCHFTEKIGGSEKHFEFVPDDHALIIDKSDIAMVESDFASGAYVYRSAKKEKEWQAELVFTSYEQRPQIYLKLDKSPFNQTPLSIVKECE